MPFMRQTRMGTTDRLLLLLQSVEVAGRFVSVACTIDETGRRFRDTKHRRCPVTGCGGWILGDVFVCSM
uniref:Putative secreted peptide n=1 Tax=Anopheles braziliensis TaxID=58242 RepID=A0A2M3ZTJ5_9DIPT